MSTLYLDRKGLELRADGNAMALYESGARIRTVPLSLLDRVVIRAETTFSSALVAMLAEAGICVVILSGRHGRRVGCFLGKAHNDARIRLQQYRMTQSPTATHQLAQALVRAKVRAQTTVLSHALAMRPDERKALSDAVATLRTIQTRVDAFGEAPEADRNRLVGFEGAASAAYFHAFTRLFASSLTFHHRNRRPPRDPVNACLSLGYTLLHYEAVRAAHSAGLDPYVGFLHAPAFGRESLACDLIEPLRPRLDAWVWMMFRERILRPEHFSHDQAACLLGKSGRAYFYQHFERGCGAWYRFLRRTCQLIVQTLVKNAPAFELEELDP